MADKTSNTLTTPEPLDRLRALPWRTALMAGLGASLAIGGLAATSALTDVPLIVAPFGASCALVFGAPSSPLARPGNVVGGHLISAALGLVAAALVTSAPIAMALGVGFAIAAMLLTGTLHPPAGATPIVVVLSKASWGFLLTPVLAGATVIVCAGVLFHSVLTGHPYRVVP